MLGGELSQRWHPETGNTQLPTVDSCVHQITSCKDDDDWRRQQLESMTSWLWSERYRDARACTHRYTSMARLKSMHSRDHSQ